MKFVGNLLQGKPASLEEGPVKCRSTNKYFALHRDESTNNCVRFLQILKVILWIELIVLIGWLGCVSFSHYNNYPKTDCGVSASGCKASEVVYDHNGVEDSRGRRNAPDAEDAREKCERNANATRRRLDSFAAKFLNGESSNPAVVQLRRKLIESIISESLRVSIAQILKGFFGGFAEDIATTNTSLLPSASLDYWQEFMEVLTEKFFNSTDSDIRQRTETHSLPTVEMTSEFRGIAESFYIDMRDCNRVLTDYLLSANEFNKSDVDILRVESAPISRLRVDCRDDEEQLLEERRERLEALAAAMANDRPLAVGSRSFFTSIESALNATSPSKVTVIDAHLQNNDGLKLWTQFVSDASLELKKEFYKLVRDLFLELPNANMESDAWAGYDLDKLYRNWTDGLSILTADESPEALLNITIQFGKTFNLHYVKAERENRSVDSEAPPFGALTYLEAEPEKLGVRRLRHILNGFVRLYFRVINRLGACQPPKGETPIRDRSFVKKRSITADPVPESITATCWNGEQDLALLKERRSRLDALTVENATGKLVGDDQDLLIAIETALNASSTSEIQFDEKYTKPGMMLHAINYLTSNASLELHKELYEIMRDMFLQLRSLSSPKSPEWEGHDVVGILHVVLANINLPIFPTAQSIFNNFVRIGEPFNLRYVELQNRESGSDPDKPVFGKFTYSGDGPELMGIRHMRHILDAFVKSYFKIQDPSGMCHSSAHLEAGQSPTPARDKRTVTFVPKPDRKHQKSSRTCWNEAEDRMLLEERRAMLETFTARNGLGYEYEQRTQQMFLTSIEKALNATSTSEIRFEDELLDEIRVLSSIHYLVTNASLELHKEGYELARDLFLEMHGLNHRGPEWTGWNQDDIAKNLTDGIFFSRMNMDSQTIFDNFVKFGQTFNLRYEKPENPSSGNAPYGKFINIGKEPEALGLRHLRHTLDGFVRLLYKIQNPSTPGLCSSTVQTRSKRSIEKRFVTADPVREEAIVMCWSKEQDPVLLEERQTRLENFLNKKVKDDEHDRFTNDYLESLEAALNATSTMEIHFDELFVSSTPVLRFMNYLLTNASLELHKEGYEIIRDMYLEVIEIRNHNPDWDGYDESSIDKNMTALGIVANVKMNAESIFDGFVKFGIPFNLRYQELANRDSGDESDKPVFGKFTYVGEEPEKLGVLRLRHILDGFVKLYFKIQDPSTPMVCTSNAQSSAEESAGGTPTHDQRSVTKRSVTASPNSESINETCWSEEDKVLQEERLERLANYARRYEEKEMFSSHTQWFLEGTDAALNATSASEIHSEDDYNRGSMHVFIESLADNSSLELRKEGYEISRDVHLELNELYNHNPEWDGYDMDFLTSNLTVSHFLSGNVSKEVMFNDVVAFGKAFNLRYEELGNRKSGDEANKPVFGKFTYVGQEPEKLGIRHFRHILDAIAKLYFKTQDPSSVCNSIEQSPAGEGKGEKPTADPLPEPTDAKCWSAEQDPVLLEERRARLEFFVVWKKVSDAHNLYAKNYLDAIGAALDATSISEIHFDKNLSSTMSLLWFLEDRATNLSLNLYKEGLEIARDLYFELEKLEDHNSEWKGFDMTSVANNLSNSDMSRGYERTPEIMFNDFQKIGRAFNLHYEKLEKGSTDEPDKPVYGKFIYIAEEPENLGVRHLRHILDGFVRFYFKVQNPSTLELCNSPVQTGAKRSVEKRSVTAVPVPESTTTKCWSEKEDKILEEERLERLGALALRIDSNEKMNSFTKTFLEDIEKALNATSISEIHFKPSTLRLPLLEYTEFLSENSSLDMRKEGYEINRDLHLELYKFKMHSSEWDGYNLDRIVENITASHIFTEYLNKEAMFNDIVTFSNAFNLRYEELGNRENGAEPDKPVFGKFTYAGEVPEKLGVRHLRHILDAFAKFYFKTQEPSSVCNGETPTINPIPEATNAQCWNMEHDPAFLEERRERLEAYRIWNLKYQAQHLYMQKYLDEIGEALSATSASGIHLEEKLLRSTPILSFIEHLAMNSSLELHKEGLEIARDLYLEIDEFKDRTSEWEGYDFNTIENNLTISRISDGDVTSTETTFKDIINFGRAFNLRYDDIENEYSGDRTHQPVVGKFTYLGEKPEKLGIRHIRHILDGFSRFYFKVRNPSMAAVCNSSAEGGGNTNTGQAL